MASDEFTRTKFLWLDQVAADPDVSPQAFRAGYWIATRYLNRGTRTAFPSQITLMKLLNLQTTRGVKHLTDQLADLGHISVETSHGRGTTNRYRLIMKADPVAESGGQNPPADEYDAAQERGEVATKGQPSNVPGQNIKATVEELGLTHKDIHEARIIRDAEKADPEPVAESDGDDVKAAFDLWWKQYPRKEGRGAARDAYQKIIAEGIATPEELLAGAMRYGAARADEDPQYTLGPVRWLEKEHWTDEPQPRKQSGAATSEIDGRNGAPSWTEIALAGLRDE
jgi:hypothetical protein